MGTTGPTTTTMHWSQRRALNAVARKGHARLDADLLDALSRDEATPTAMESVRHSRLSATRERAEPVPAARPATKRALVERP
jgi:hypothetical protein